MLLSSKSKVCHDDKQAFNNAKKFFFKQEIFFYLIKMIFPCPYLISSFLFSVLTGKSNIGQSRKEKRKVDSHQNKQIRISCQLRKKLFAIKIEMNFLIRKQFSPIKKVDFVLQLVGAEKWLMM
jgi:hypothetical protein